MNKQSKAFASMFNKCIKYGSNSPFLNAKDNIDFVKVNVFNCMLYKLSSSQE